MLNIHPGIKPHLKLKFTFLTGFTVFSLWTFALAMPVALAQTSAPNPTPGPAAEKLFMDSRRLFYKNDFDGALGLLQKYFEKLVSHPVEKARTKLRFAAIVAMGRIYLQEKQDPAGAIQWFEKIEKTQVMTTAEKDIVDGWIAGARDWIKLGKFPKDTHSEKDLFALGDRYYQSGLKKQKYIMDESAAADFSIASAYLIPFIVHFDKSPSVGQALFEMGDIRRRLWADNEFWSENYYLTEAIRRFPATPLAVKAYSVLEEDVHFGYTGTSGDHTPHSWIVLLGELKELAQGTSEAPAEILTPKTTQ